MKINEQDVKKLDAIVEKVLEDGNTMLNTDKEGRYYRNIFEHFDVLRVWKTKDGFYLLPIDKGTEYFFNNGGFETIYKQQKENEETERIIQNKNFDEAKIIKWQKWTYWPTVGIALAGFVLSIISLTKGC